jgi:hypothetical protein
MAAELPQQFFRLKLGSRKRNRRGRDKSGFAYSGGGLTVDQGEIDDSFSGGNQDGRGEADMSRQRVSCCNRQIKLEELAFSSMRYCGNAASPQILVR